MYIDSQTILWALQLTLCGHVSEGNNIGRSSNVGLVNSLH